MMKKKNIVVGLISPEKNVSNLQMSMTFVLTISLILSNIMVVKSIDMFGLKWLPNTCAIITFPITYILSDVFSEVYGYKWSRVTASWAFIGAAIASIFFALTIAMPGNSSWTNQDALVSILGNAPRITVASIAAYWLGDLVNDKVFAYMKSRDMSGRYFWLRAIVSSIAGKYFDQIVFTFVGLSFLPLRTRIIMVISCPIGHIIFEAMLLPLTILVKNTVKRIECESVPVE